MISLRVLGVLSCVLVLNTVAAIQCYRCDNSVSPACGRYFKAYQFDPEVCNDNKGRKSICGKQEQPPDRNGWTGVIRSCYYPGDLPGINETMGCHHFFHDLNNFSALYCFCDTDYCNSAPHSSLALIFMEIWALILTISALV